MHLLGVKTLIVSNAAGGVNENFKLGDVMIIKDHIFLPAMCGFSPFIGADDKRFGSTFISMHGAYDSILRCVIFPLLVSKPFNKHLYTSDFTFHYWHIRLSDIGTIDVFFNVDAEFSIR